ncbi:MAG: glycosyl transferase family protein, partial [Proteobacteria bacterium]|nr:glycosyl transferase family protein [Pseudomonadota bacterium]
LPRPIFMYAGRVAIEKNIEAFLSLDLPGSKVVIGDGPQRQELEARYPSVAFVGYKMGEELAQHLADANAFVFPSRTDTFGLVMLEALACGVPVAAFPVQGPNDVILDERIGCLDEDLGRGAMRALSLLPADCRAYATGYSWEQCARQFEGNLAPIGRIESRPAAWWQRSARKPSTRSVTD